MPSTRSAGRAVMLGTKVEGLGPPPPPMMSKRSTRTHAPKNGEFSAAVIQLLQSSAAAFFRADLNGDQRLDADEFAKIIPASTGGKYAEKDVRELFDQCDYDKSGSITRDEFFMWSLSWCDTHSGVVSALEQAFMPFDTTGDGALNLREFTLAVEGFGFGELGHNIFDELDRDQSGTISFVELQAALKARRGVYSLNAQRLLTAMSFTLVQEAAHQDKQTAHARELNFRDEVCSDCTVFRLHCEAPYLLPDPLLWPFLWPALRISHRSGRRRILTACARRFVRGCSRSSRGP